MIRSTNFYCFFICQTLNSTSWFPVEFHIVHFPILIDQCKSLNTEAFHVPVILWNTHIIKEPGKCGQAFRKVGAEVEDPPVLLDVRLWIRFKSMDHIWEFDCITDEKNRDTVTQKIPITLSSQEKITIRMCKAIEQIRAC